MSANLPKELDLNADAVPVDDHEEVSRGSIEEYLGTVGKSLCEIETETLTGRGMGDVRVSDSLREPVVQRSDICVEQCLGKEGTTTVEGDSCLVGGEKIGIDVGKMERSTKVGELFGEEIGVVGEGNVAEKGNVGVPNLNVSGEYNYCLEENGGSKVKAVSGDMVENEGVGLVSSAGVESVRSEDIRMSLVENVDSSAKVTSMEIKKGDTMEKENYIVLNRVEEADKVELCPVEGSLNGGDGVMVDTESVPEFVNGVAKSSPQDEVVTEAIVPPSESQGNGFNVKHLESPANHFDENGADGATEDGRDREQKVETGDPISGIQQSNMENQNVERASSEHGLAFVKEAGTSYCLTTVKEGEFSKYDMVWGKVRSHPWWPGQILDPSDASELAMKYHKTDRHLVAYFGDQSFAWNETSALKPFKLHFSRMEKQTNMEAFCDAVNCALDEVSRRVELGLSCSCTPEEVNSEIKSQIITNSGIREGVYERDSVDISLSAASFEPVKLMEYIKALALYPCGGADRLELVIVQAQLAAFYGSKGYFQLPEFHVYEGLTGDDVGADPLTNNLGKESSQKRKLRSRDYSSHKRQHTSEDDSDPGKKERSLTDLMGRKNSRSYSKNSVKSDSDRKGAIKSALLSSGKMGKTGESFSNYSRVQNRNRKHVSSREHDTESSRSTKVGERISRIASQLAGSPPVLKYNGERLQKGAVGVDESSEELQEVAVGFTPNTPQRSIKQPITTPKEDSSPDEMLSQLCLAAQNPMKRNSFLSVIIGFFTDFRNSISMDHSCSATPKKHEKKTSTGEIGVGNENAANTKTSCSETCNQEHMNDSYWTDMIIQSSPEGQPLDKKRKKRGRGRPPGKKQKKKAESQFETECHNFEQQISMELSPVLDSKKDTSTFQPEDCFQLNPMDLKKDNPDDDGNLVMVDNSNVGDFSPTELILKFTDADSIPPERELNNIFSRFGPLKESETEILRKTSRAKVVFQRRNDADVAFSSAGKFSTFGPALVSYQLRSPSKASPHVTRQRKKSGAPVQGNTS